MMLPLLRAVQRGEDVIAPLESLIRSFGFDTFLYATARRRRFRGDR
jgi:hypothetical protein